MQVLCPFARAAALLGVILDFDCKLDIFKCDFGGHVCSVDTLFNHLFLGQLIVLLFFDYDLFIRISEVFNDNLIQASLYFIV